MYRVISLFAGIGGICLGFNQSGAKVIWANEIDSAACLTYRENLGTSYLHEGDIRSVSTTEIPDFDILTAGFPCQAFSVAGYRKGFEDERGNVFFEIIRILEAKMPRAIMLENVKNLTSHDQGRTFTIIISELEKLGYKIKHQILNTMDFGNIPQNRERIYIVGFLDQQSFDTFQFPTEIELTTNISNIVDTTKLQDSKYYYTNSVYYDLLKNQITRKDTVYQWRRVYLRENKSNVCPTLTANMGTGGHNVPLILDDHDIRKLTPEECLKFQGFPDSYKYPLNMSNSSKYKQAGNSVSVPVIKRIATSMLHALEMAKD
jgi:DNA (cytosine-5)-methyltransferase 1